MMSTSARYPIKPKTLTLLELCQSIADLRQTSVNQPQSTPNAAQTLTRRLYLHPLAINSNGKQSLAKLASNVISPESDQRRSSFPDKNRNVHRPNKKSSDNGLAVLSSSFPLTARSNPARPSRDKISAHPDDDTHSDFDLNTTVSSWNQSNSLPSIARGTLSSTHTTCTRPSCTINHHKKYWRPDRLDKISGRHGLDRTLRRPEPMSPPPTPLNQSMALFDQPTESLGFITAPVEPITAPLETLDTETNSNIENDETEDDYFNYRSIQSIRIYKRNARQKSFINDEIDYDEYIYNLK